MPVRCLSHSSLLSFNAQMWYQAVTCYLAVTCCLAATGTYSNLVKQAKSKQKILDKMEAAGLTPPVQHESTFHFQFPDCDKLPPPVLPFQDVSFAYSGQDKDCLYRVSYCRGRVKVFM